MSTNFPASLDTSTELPSNRTNNTAQLDSHPSDHNNLADAVIALETKVGVNSSAVTSTIDYKLTNSSSINPGHKHRYQQILTVAKSGGDYTSIQSAIDSISDNSSSKRYLIRVMPGLYTEQITMKAFVDIRGAGKHATQLQFTGNNNGTVILASDVQIEDLLIEATTVSTEWAIVGSNTSRVHIRNVDILGLDNTYVSQGIKLSGNSWLTLFIEHCVINYLGTTGYGIHLAGNSTTPQNCDTHIVDTFVDSFNATTGGSIRIDDLFAGRIRTSLLRTSSSGFDLQVNDTSANTSDVLVESSTLEFGTSSVEVDAGATAIIKHSAIDSTSGSGTVTYFNAATTSEIADVTTGAESAGTSGSFARGDHVHHLAFSGARVYNSGDFTHDNSGGEKIITFDTEDFDTDAYHSTVSNTSRLTAPTTGYYMVGGQIRYESNATGSRSLDIKVDGTTYVATGFRDNSGDILDLSNSTLVHLTAGQYVELGSFQSSGANRLINDSVFWIYRLG